LLAVVVLRTVSTTIQNFSKGTDQCQPFLFSQHPLPLTKSIMQIRVCNHQCQKANTRTNVLPI
jgi:hypothetical protein